MKDGIAHLTAPDKASKKRSEEPEIGSSSNNNVADTNNGRDRGDNRQDNPDPMYGAKEVRRRRCTVLRRAYRRARNEFVIAEKRVEESWATLDGSKSSREECRRVGDLIRSFGARMMEMDQEERPKRRGIPWRRIKW